MVLREHPSLRAAGDIMPIDSASASIICSLEYFLYVPVLAVDVDSTLASSDNAFPF